MKLRTLKKRESRFDREDRKIRVRTLGAHDRWWRRAKVREWEEILAAAQRGNAEAMREFMRRELAFARRYGGRL